MTSDVIQLRNKVTSRVFNSKSIPLSCASQQITAALLLFEAIRSASVYIRFSSHYPSVPPVKEEGVAAPLQFLMKHCVCCTCVLCLCVCITEYIGCLSALPWIQLDVNLRNSIIPYLSSWKILNEEILESVSRLITRITTS